MSASRNLLEPRASSPSPWPPVSARRPSCSYATVAIAKKLFQKGASAASALAFQFASTNLVFELGLVIWVLISWQFALAEFVGGLVLVVVMTLMLRLFVSKPLEEQGAPTPLRRTPAISATRRRADADQRAPDLGRSVVRRRAQLPQRLDDALEITIGFVLAGFVG